MRGFVYVMTNSSMPDLVKVGFSMKDPALRAQDLSGTSVPTAFEVVYDALIESPYEIEQIIHAELRDQGVAAGKEFFRLGSVDAIATLRGIIESRDVVLFAESRITSKCQQCGRWSPRDAPPACCLADDSMTSFDDAMKLFENRMWDEGVAALEALKSIDPRADFELALARMGELAGCLDHRIRWTEESLRSGDLASSAGYEPATRWLYAVYAGGIIRSLRQPAKAAVYERRLALLRSVKKISDEELEMGIFDDELTDQFSHVDVLL